MSPEMKLLIPQYVIVAALCALGAWLVLSWCWGEGAWYHVVAGFAIILWAYWISGEAVE